MACLLGYRRRNDLARLCATSTRGSLRRRTRRMARGPSGWVWLGDTTLRITDYAGRLLALGGLSLFIRFSNYGTATLLSPHPSSVTICRCSLGGGFPGCSIGCCFAHDGNLGLPVTTSDNRSSWRFVGYRNILKWTCCCNSIIMYQLYSAIAVDQGRRPYIYVRLFSSDENDLANQSPIVLPKRATSLNDFRSGC
jgi:hypothetical protein